MSCPNLVYNLYQTNNNWMIINHFMLNKIQKLSRIEISLNTSLRFLKKSDGYLQIWAYWTWMEIMSKYLDKMWLPTFWLYGFTYYVSLRKKMINKENDETFRQGKIIHFHYHSLSLIDFTDQFILSFIDVKFSSKMALTLVIVHVHYKN